MTAADPGGLQQDPAPQPVPAGTMHLRLLGMQFATVWVGDTYKSRGAVLQVHVDMCVHVVAGCQMGICDCSAEGVGKISMQAGRPCSRAP